MIAVARYLLASYGRTRAYVAPLAVLILGVAAIYSVRPNPVLETAASVAVLLFFVQGWLALTCLGAAGRRDRETLAAAAGTSALAGGRLLATAVLGLATALAAVAYPVVAGRFDHTPSPSELALCLAASVAATLAAGALAAPFAAPAVRNRAVAILGLAACQLATIPLGFPAVAIARALDAPHAAARLAPVLAGVGALAAASAAACQRLWRP